MFIHHIFVRGLQLNSYKISLPWANRAGASLFENRKMDIGGVIFCS
jgi:hypothetical protein